MWLFKMFIKQYTVAGDYYHERYHYYKVDRAVTRSSCLPYPRTNILCTPGGTTAGTFNMPTSYH